MGLFTVTKKTISTAKTTAKTTAEVARKAKAAVDAKNSTCDGCGKTIVGGARRGANMCGKACAKAAAANW